MSELILTSDNTPRVTDLTLINLGEVEPENFNVSLPKLKHVVIHFLTIDSDESINTILHTARKLKSFESYKLWTFPELEFASNALESINIRRSYCPERVSIWARNIQHLGLASCYDMDTIEILDQHTLASKLPDGQTRSKFDVDITNLCEARELYDILRSPSCHLCCLES